MELIGDKRKMKNERKEELKDEMKNRISLALKDPILQQGFEIICKENAELKEENAELEAENEANENGAKKYAEFYFQTNEKLNKAKEIIKRLLCVVRNHLCIADISFNILINDAEKILKEE